VAKKIVVGLNRGLPLIHCRGECVVTRVREDGLGAKRIVCVGWCRRRVVASNTKVDLPSAKRKC